MNEVVVDTNVLLVAEGKHGDVCGECVNTCTQRLRVIKERGVVVVDDDFRIFGEYQHRLSATRGKGAGTVFLKWLLQNKANTRRVHQIRITEPKTDWFREFPVEELQGRFDPSDRKFPAVAYASAAKPPILQAADCKWLDWWPQLRDAGIVVDFLCPEDVKRFYVKKFPKKPIPVML